MQMANPREAYIHQVAAENPTDSPQVIRFWPTMQTFFAVASWDLSLKVFEILEGNKLRLVKAVSLPAFPLAMDFLQDGSHLFLSLGDKSVYTVDATTFNINRVATMASNLLFMQFVPQSNVFVTINETNMLEFYAPNDWTKTLFRAQLSNEISAIDIFGKVLLLGTTSSKFCFVDIGTVTQYQPSDFEFLESVLKTPITKVAINADTRIFSLGSCDGRVYVGAFEQVGAMSGFGGQNQNKVRYTSVNTKDTSKSYIFVAHSKKLSDNSQIANVYSVTGMGFSARSKNLLYTCGSEGQIIFWDVVERNKTIHLNFQSCVSAVALSPNGVHLAFGLAYDWSQGVWGTKDVNNPPKIGFRMIMDDELVYRKPGTYQAQTNTGTNNYFGKNHVMI